MARQQFYVASWADYDVGDPKTVPRADLEAAVRKAAKAANQRLLRLERAGATTGVYMSAMQDLGLDRKRFKERPQKLSIAELRHEYASLRSFLSAQTSTIQGRKQRLGKIYNTLQARGYEGSYDEAMYDLEKAFTEHIEQYFDSKTVYDAVVKGNVDLLETLANKQEEIRAAPDKGRVLLDYMHQAKERRENQPKGIAERAKLKGR